MSGHPPARLRTIVFDIDDTLVDYSRANTRGLFGHLAEVAPWTVDEPGVEALWNDIGDASFDRFLAGELSFDEQRRARVRAFCAEAGIGQGGSDGEADQWMAGFLKHCEAALRPFDDVEPALDALADGGFLLAAMSNSTHANQDRKLTLAGLRHRFSTLTCVDDAGGAAKPAPAIFHAACETLRVRPEEAAYVGDRLDTDAYGAAAAGLTGIWLDRGSACGATAPAMPDSHLGVQVIHSLSELPGVVQALIPTFPEATYS